ncbi:lipid-A-disaccharide synthase [Candidatus Poribacteria bacterium]|nr:lipid-A-disaccharide synthase [Candidatus Poribacteria bacterium]
MARSPCICVCSGESSGDLHGAALVGAIRQQEPNASVFGMGGDKMRAAGVELVIDIADSSIMGLTEVVRAIPAFLRKLRLLCRAIESRRPDVVVLIDFPDFNMRLGQRVRGSGVPVVYFIPPKAWAWRRRRGPAVAKMAERVICILPFEAAFYRSCGATVEDVGNPLVDVIRDAHPLDRDAARERFGMPPGAPTVGLLPGSRRREIDALMGSLLGAAERLVTADPSRRFLLPCAPSVRASVADHLAAFEGQAPIHAVHNDTYNAIRACDVVVAASGTVTLEAALLGVPMVVVYRLSALTFTIARRLVRVRTSALPNLIAGTDVVPELLQNDVTPERIAAECERLLTSAEARGAQRDALAKVARAVGDGGSTARAAEAVLTVAASRATT